MSEPVPRKTSCQEALEKAVEAREQFLREQPHLRSFQDEIDRILEKTVGFENRMSVLSFMMEAKLYELKEAVASLHSATVKVHGLFENPKA